MLTNWSTQTVEPGERFSFWREAVCDAFLDLVPESRREASFYGHICVERSKRIEVARISAAQQRVERKPSHDGGWCYLNVQVRGTGQTTQAGTSVVTRPGDSVILRTDSAFSFEFDGDFAQTSVRLPEELTPLVRSPVFLEAGAQDSTFMRALIDFNRAPNCQDRSPSEQHDLMEWRDLALIGLVRSAIRHRAGASVAGARIDLWPLIDADIDRHLGDPHLCPTDTARRVGLSVRSLHKTLQDHPLTFAREVRARRLSRARRLLLDDANVGLRVRDIAADCGFVSVEHFHRIFREEFGFSPASVRRVS